MHGFVLNWGLLLQIILIAYHHIQALYVQRSSIENLITLSYISRCKKIAANNADFSF